MWKTLRSLFGAARPAHTIARSPTDLDGMERKEGAPRASRAQDEARKLEMDEPMAGAGAQISGQSRSSQSETERALKRATGKR